MSSKSFDYARAWAETARPMYDCLPADVRQLFVDTAEAAADLHQLRDCSMPWPEETVRGISLRERFDKVPMETLALASRVIYFLGHWRPQAGELPPAEDAACKAGAHWKFSHYADQVLREKLGLPARGNHSGNGFSFAVHEGAIRLCHVTRHSWSWQELAPATANGLEHARAIQRKLQAAFAGIPFTHVHKRNSALWQAWNDQDGHNRREFEHWPVEWHRIKNTGEYMTDPALHGTVEQRTVLIAETRAKVIANCDETIARTIRKQQIERDGKVWLLDRGILVDNVIYYDHTGVFGFGWREKASAAWVGQLLEVISEFPWPYSIDCAPTKEYPHGRKLEGGQG